MNSSKSASKYKYIENKNQQKVNQTKKKTCQNKPY